MLRETGVKVAPVPLGSSGAAGRAAGFGVVQPIQQPFAQNIGDFPDGHGRTVAVPTHRPPVNSSLSPVSINNPSILLLKQKVRHSKHAPPDRSYDSATIAPT
jgi:hypothetical protein